MIALLLLVGAAAAADATPFEPSPRSFTDSGACKAFLAASAGEARGQAYDAVEGPYDVAAGDVRIHTVSAEGKGHRIVEQRCLDSALSGRSWRHSLEGIEKGVDDGFSVESVARSAPWLRKDAGRP